MPAPAVDDAPRPLDGAARLVRSVAAALVCLVTAAVGHGAAGATLQPVAAIAVFAGATAVTGLLSSRRVTPGQIVGLLVLCQVCVHLGAGPADMTMSVGMLAGHAAATALSAVLLTRGESFVWRLAERLVPAPTSITACSGSLTAAPLPVRTSRARHDVRLTHSRVVRGPPTGS